MASKPKRSSFPAGRSGAAQYQAAVRKFNASNKPAETPRRKGGGQGGTGGRTTRATRGNRNVSNVTPGSNPLSRAEPTKPGQSAYREEQEARRKAGKTYNPNNSPRKPSVEPGSNPLQRAAKEQERKEKAAAAARAKAERERKARDNKPKPVKPTKPAATKPSKPTKPAQPANAGAGNGAPRPAGKVPATAAKKPHIKSDRLRDALKSVKKYKPKK